MKSGLKKLLGELQAETVRTRETKAEKVLNPETVRSAVYEAAKAGHAALRVKIPDGLDVRNTAAAAAVMTWAKKEGLTLTWHKRVVDLPDNRRVDVHEPEFAWLIAEL
jgi:hypothetical protein